MLHPLGPRSKATRVAAPTPQPWMVALPFAFEEGTSGPVLAVPASPASESLSVSFFPSLDTFAAKQLYQPVSSLESQKSNSLSSFYAISATFSASQQCFC